MEKATDREKRREKVSKIGDSGDSKRLGHWRLPEALRYGGPLRRRVRKDPGRSASLMTDNKSPEMASWVAAIRQTICNHPWPNFSLFLSLSFSLSLFLLLFSFSLWCPIDLWQLE